MVNQTKNWAWTKIFGITLLGWANILFFQWFFIRLAFNWVIVDPEFCEEARTDEFWDDEQQRFVAKTFYYYAIIGVIWPLTGWGKDRDYKTIFKKFKKRISKVSEYYE